MIEKYQKLLLANHYDAAHVIDMSTKELQKEAEYVMSLEHCEVI